MFKNIKLSYKLILSTMVFMLPICVLLFFVINGYNKDIDKSYNEKNGNIALGTVVYLTNDIIEYHNLINSIRINDIERNNNSIKIQQNLLKDSIDNLIQKVINNCNIYNDKINQNFKLQNNTNLDYSPKNLQNLWEKIKKYSDNYDLSSLNHNIDIFYNNSLLLIRFIADESGLVLDPDLDSYYLMDLSVLVIPRMQIDLGKINNIINSSYSNGIIYDFDANKVKILKDIIFNEDIKRIERDINTSILEDKNYYSTSPTLAKHLNSFLKKYKNDLGIYERELEDWYSGNSDINDDELFHNLLFLSRKTLNSTNDLWNVINQEFNILLDMRIDYYKNYRNIVLLSSGIAFIIAIILILFISKQISRYLGIVTDIAVEIAEGNIDKAVNDLKNDDKLKVFKKFSESEIQVKDEILILFKAIQKMTLNLSSLLLQVSKSGNIVSKSSFSIISSARDIEATVTEQAALTNQVNATSNDISKTSTELALTMEFITESFHNNAMMLIEGLNKLNEIKKNISDLFNSTNDISQKLEIIKSKVAGIGTVITTITKVANQTNLVSLNASIEAERAGAFGTGFAVVAREIRRLADQTSIAALNIEDMINDMQIAVTESGDTIVSYMENAKNSTEKTSNIIDQISSVIDKTNELPEKIFLANLAMKQQSESAIQINDSMTQLNIAAIQTRNTIIEFNSATEKLNDAVKGLNDELCKFSLEL